MRKVVPVVLAGGVGSRLWPLSREDRPKQFLPLVSANTMLQDTLARLADAALFDAPAVICHERYAGVVTEQSRAIGADLSALILEPMAKNSAPAVAAAALHFAARDPETLLLISPADHLITEPERFRTAVAEARALAETGRLTTFGIAPDRPETGYGYIKGGALVDGVAVLGAPGREVAAFVEKPDLATAETYLASGDYSWNSGMFLFRAGDMIREMRLHAPDLLAAVEGAVERGERDGVALRLHPERFDAADEISIDYAVMERTEHAAVATVNFGWSDIGAWDALAEKLPSDADGNVALGAAALIGARDVYCRSDGPFVAAIGVEGLAIIATEDAVLVCPKDQAQKVKEAFQLHKKRLAEG